MYVETLIESVSELAESFAADRETLVKFINEEELGKSYNEAYDLLNKILERRERGWEIVLTHLEFLPIPA